MEATALRARSTQAAAGTTAAGTTNGPSSSTATTGGGPTAAPSQPALLGEKILPAPVGEPQTIHLADGSMLVPVARVDATGNRTPLTGGPGSAPLQYNASMSTPAFAPAAHAPVALLYNDLYFKKYFDGGNFNANDSEKVKERAIESTFLYLLDKEPNVDDFGVNDVKVRRADPAADRDLLTIDPNAQWIIDVHGVQGDGTKRSIPSVMNADGATYTDPRIGSR